MTRLRTISQIAATANRPVFDPQAHDVGIVHLGVGAFHRAHQAVYTDDAIAASGGDWRIRGVSLRSSVVADQLNPQNGLYTLIERGSDGSRARVIGSLERVLVAPEALGDVMAALVLPQVRIVSLTITEKAYGIERATGQIDPQHPAIAADLINPRSPVGAVGLIVEALRQRRQSGTLPFTALCCDNLPENGGLLEAGVIDFANRIDAELGQWIAQNVSFPSTMVDRITPATTDQTLADARALIGCSDLASVEAEPFRQWIIEDDFPTGRPAWEAGGAIFVADVMPYEMMKLRMLNGAHSMLAYVGQLASCEYVRDVMARSDLSHLVDRQMRAAQATLPTLDGVDLDRYRQELAERFANKAIAHRTEQIAMDGTEKLPQRIFAPAADTLEEGGDLGPFAFAVAAWMAFCVSRLRAGKRLDDPRHDAISAALETASSARETCDTLLTIGGSCPPALRDSDLWKGTVTGKLQTLLQSGIDAAILEELR